MGWVHGYMRVGLADPAPYNPPVTDTGYVTACRLGMLSVLPWTSPTAQCLVWEDTCRFFLKKNVQKTGKKCFCANRDLQQLLKNLRRYLRTNLYFPASFVPRLARETFWAWNQSNKQKWRLWLKTLLSQRKFHRFQSIK